MKHILTILLALALFFAITTSAQDVQWTARFDGGSTTDVPLAMDMDDSGNAYIAGYSYGAGGDDNVRLVKISPAGEIVWTRVYDGGFGWDDARDVKVGPDGSVTIAGFTVTEKDQDVLVIRYDAGGIRQWITTWTSRGRDDGKTLDIDAEGNVYVGAEAEGEDLSQDYVVFKLDSTGNLAWQQRYARHLALVGDPHADRRHRRRYRHGYRRGPRRHLRHGHHSVRHGW